MSHQGFAQTLEDPNERSLLCTTAEGYDKLRQGLPQYAEHFGPERPGSGEQLHVDGLEQWTMCLGDVYEVAHIIGKRVEGGAVAWCTCARCGAAPRPCRTTSRAGAASSGASMALAALGAGAALVAAGLANLAVSTPECVGEMCERAMGG